MLAQTTGNRAVIRSADLVVMQVGTLGHTGAARGIPLELPAQLLGVLCPAEGTAHKEPEAEIDQPDRQEHQLRIRSIASQIRPATLVPSKRSISCRPVGEVTLISVR